MNESNTKLDPWNVKAHMVWWGPTKDHRGSHNLTFFMLPSIHSKRKINPLQMSKSSCTFSCDCFLLPFILFVNHLILFFVNMIKIKELMFGSAISHHLVCHLPWISYLNASHWHLRISYFILFGPSDQC